MYDRDLAQVAEQTGLSERYIRHCLAKLKTIIRPHVSYGANNKMLFGDDALALFALIKELRDQGKQVNEIRAYFEGDKASVFDRENPVQPTSNLPASMSWQARQAMPNTQPSDTDRFLNHLQQELEESKEREADLRAKLDRVHQDQLAQHEEWRKELESKAAKLSELEKGVLQLTGGQNPVEFKTLQQEYGQKRAALIHDLSALEGKWWKGRQRKQLLKELEQYL